MGCYVKARDDRFLGTLSLQSFLSGGTAGVRFYFRDVGVGRPITQDAARPHKPGHQFHARVALVALFFFVSAFRRENGQCEFWSNFDIKQLVVGCEVLAAVSTKMAGCWAVAPCILV